MKVLLIEKNVHIRELEAMMLKSQFVTDVVQVESGAEGLEKIESDEQFDIVISGYNLNLKNGLDVFRGLRKTSKRVPFLLVSSTSHREVAEFNNDPYFEMLQKPFDEELLIGKVQLLAQNIEINNWSSGYVPVPVSILEKMNSVSVPLFIQLSEKHFVKISHGRTLFSAADAERMKAKGLAHLFVDLASYSVFLSQYRKNVFSQVSWDEADSQVGMQILARDWDLVLKASRAFGCSQEVVNLAFENIARALSILEKPVEFKEIFKSFSESKQNRLSSHCYMVATLSTALVKELGWTAPTTLQKLTFTSLLHDMDLDEELFTSKQTLLNSTDFKNFGDDPDMKRLFDHPQRASERLALWPGCPSDVDEIVLQHHEKVDGSGFPSGINHQMIGPLSAVFILAEDIIYHCVDNFGVQPLAYLKSKHQYYQHGEFLRIYAAMEKVLSQK